MRLLTPLTDITPFKGKDDVLSNFYLCHLKVFERKFKSSEHAYQFMKAKFYGRDRLAEDICKQRTACAAKRLGKKLPTEESWENEKLDVMREIIKAKVRDVPLYRRTLLEARTVTAEAVPGINFWSSGLSN